MGDRFFGGPKEPSMEIETEGKRDLRREIENVPAEQKQTILKIYEEIYTQYPPDFYHNEKGEIDVEKLNEFTGKFNEGIRQPNSGFKENDSWDDPKTNLAKAAAISDVQTSPEKYAEYQRSLEIACASEVRSLWEKYEWVLRTGEVPKTPLKNWLENGREEEKKIIEKYGPLLGEERVERAILAQNTEGEEKQDHLIYRLRAFEKPVLRMNESELVEEWFNKRWGAKPSRDFEAWLKSK